MRKSRFDSLSLRIGEFVIAEAHQVHHYPFGSKCGMGCRCAEIPGVVCSAIASQTFSISTSEIPWLREILVRRSHHPPRSANNFPGSRLSGRHHGTWLPCRKAPDQKSALYAFPPRSPKNRRAWSVETDVLSVSRMNCVASRANWLSGFFAPKISLLIMAETKSRPVPLHISVAKLPCSNALHFDQQRSASVRNFDPMIIHWTPAMH